MKKEGFEVTTYRVDGEYEDGRHPKEVTFTACLEEDLKRRDFTINAMAYNPRKGLVDLFEGQKDLENKVIRCVGDPLERFTEDALRIMRAVRFSAQLGFSLEEETRKALSVLAPNLKHVSAERIQVELVKLLISPHRIICGLPMKRVLPGNFCRNLTAVWRHLRTLHTTAIMWENTFSTAFCM